MAADGTADCKGKGKTSKAPPPPKAKGAQKGHKGVDHKSGDSGENCKQPAPLQDVPRLPKPQPEEALKFLATLQASDGTWEPSEELANGMGLHVSALDIPRKPSQDVPSWNMLVSTTLACQALQRCISIIGSWNPDAAAGRSSALEVAAEHSVLGSKVLDAAGEWLDVAWDKASQRCRIRQRHELDLKVKTLLEEPFPLPSWKAQLKAKMAIHKTCELCGSEYTAAVAKCVRCFPPERSSVIDADLDNQEWRCLPAAPLHVDWKQCEGALHVEGGSGGVTLLRVGGGVLVLKKQRMTAAAEYLAIKVAKVIGIRVADMRLISWAEAEFQEINAAIRKTPSFEKNPLLGIWRSTEFLGILEYIPGCTVQGPEFQRRLQDMQPDSVRDFWSQVGEIIAYDALINNVDRVPLLWDNEGNTANLMLPDTGVKEKVVGIDQAVANIIPTGPGRERFLFRLKDLSEAVFRERWQDSPSVTASLERVSECFLLSCGVQVDKASLMAGLRQGLTKVADLMEDGSLTAALDEAIVKGNEIFRAATVDIGHKELPNMRDFLLATAETIVSARREALAM